MAFAKNVILLIVSLALLSGCQHEASKELILLDFESDAELDQLYWKCHVLYSLSNEHATHGTNSLKLELFPSEYPGLEFSPGVKDWSGYKTLSLDVFNPSTQHVQLAIRIDDKKGYPDYAARYNKGFIIAPGANHIAIPLSSLTASGTNRQLDIANMQRMFIFVAHPHKKITLFIDAIRLQ